MNGTAPAPVEASTPELTGARNPNHPIRKHDVARPEVMVTPSSDVPAPFPGQARRRDRRALARYQARHYEVSGSIGGEGYESSVCACGTFLAAPTSALLREVADRHYRSAA